jgi:hypothetical protein
MLDSGPGVPFNISRNVEESSQADGPADRIRPVRRHGDAGLLCARAPVALVDAGFRRRVPAGSAYGFLQGAWPFGLVEAVWALVAARRWWRARGLN